MCRDKGSDEYLWTYAEVSAILRDEVYSTVVEVKPVFSTNVLDIT